MSLKKIRIGNVAVSYLDEGSGAPLLLVHCSRASHKEWGFMSDDLVRSRRIVAPDLIGYGKSESWPKDNPMPFDADVQVLESLLDAIGEPVDLIGHSYGAAMCLELARREARRGSSCVKSMVLIEPVSFHLLKDGQDRKSWQIAQRVASGCISHADKGRLDKAADVYMGFWLGALKWRLAPKRFRASVTRTVAKVADEFRGIYRHSADHDEYRLIDCPVTLIRGMRTQRPAKAVIDILAGMLPNASVIDVPGAGHMSPFTHPDTIRGLCLSHLWFRQGGRSSRDHADLRDSVARVA